MHVELGPEPLIGRDEDKPWWWHRCIHRDYSYYSEWEVMLEAEGAAVLHLDLKHHVHILVDLPGHGSVCKTVSCAEYDQQWDDRKLMEYIQDKRRELRQL